jgi:hypothetical protein
MLVCQTSDWSPLSVTHNLAWCGCRTGTSRGGTVPPGPHRRSASMLEQELCRALHRSGIALKSAMAGAATWLPWLVHLLTVTPRTHVYTGLHRRHRKHCQSPNSAQACSSMCIGKEPGKHTALLALPLRCITSSSLILPPMYIPCPPWSYQEPCNIGRTRVPTRVCRTRVSPLCYADEYEGEVNTRKQPGRHRALKHGCRRL